MAVLHEIGHYFLHVDRNDPFGEPAYLDRSSAAFYLAPREEREANEFAAVLLFGDGVLTGAKASCGSDVARLARYFGVSEYVIEIALGQF